ncbi:hypothetical protein PTTG_29369 [Puccinia triticina 1-1 BBBD Race 1]|uniref:Uncharacterized protein n=1 Tax=Puccinia triticina (isolate 1-1 / race 1 (BBBD)) TaxID=630390 RepID=A0A180G5A5_PUCT1|nr:hypothetical protein PTTG_29369 [Puccinia triticina 1-1 BBBD Race 1]
MFPLPPPTTSHSHNTQQQVPANLPSAAHSAKLTIIKSLTIRTEVYRIHGEFNGSKPSWSKYQSTWNSLAPLLQNRARAMHPTHAVSSATFHLQRQGCLYGSWIQSITSLAAQFLSPSRGEQWYCSDLIDFPKLTSFGDKTNDLRPGSFIPTVTKTPHPESTLVRGLFRLLHPPTRLHVDWAKIVATSVELVADNLFCPPQFTSDHANDHVCQGVEALAYLAAVNNLASNFDVTQQNDDPSTPSAQRLHSVDVLHDFRNVIIDVLMAYIILQTHFLAEPPLTPAQKKANHRAHRAPVNSAAATLVPNAPTDIANLPPNPINHLQKYSRQQNFQPLVYFVLAGVRGLIITSRDHRVAGISTCMSLIQAMFIIRRNSSTPHTLEEPIWKNVSAYLVKIFLPIFQSPEKICPLDKLKVPSRFELAEAITTDFLNQWQALNPTSPFLLPQSPPQLANA